MYLKVYIPAIEGPRATIHAPVNVAKSTICNNVSKMSSQNGKKRNAKDSFILYEPKALILETQYRKFVEKI